MSDSLVQTTEKEVLVIKEAREILIIENQSGPSGLSFLSGNGVPSNSYGSNGETYLDLQSGFLYKKSNNIWNLEGSLVGPAGQGAFETEIFTLNSTQIANKEITLAVAPVGPARTTVDVQNAPTQAYGIDFIVIGDKLSWASIGFELLLEVGTIIIVRYYKS